MINPAAIAQLSATLLASLGAPHESEAGRKLFRRDSPALFRVPRQRGLDSAEAVGMSVRNLFVMRNIVLNFVRLRLTGLTEHNGDP